MSKKTSIESRKSMNTFKGSKVGDKVRTSLLKDEYRIMKPNSNRAYKGSFCHVNEHKEPPSYDNTPFSAGIKTPLKHHKVSLNLTKTDKVSSREPYVTAITLDVVSEPPSMTKAERTNSYTNSSNILSNRMSNETNSNSKSYGLNTMKKKGSKEKVKTSLEIYSK